MPTATSHLSPSERARLFAVAERSVRELRQFIQGERDLTAAEVEARKGFIRQASRESFYFFAKAVLGYDKMTNQTHKRWADELQRKWLKVDFFMRLKPRGTFKTTLYGCAFILWVWAVYTPELRFFYTSANQTLLDEVSAEIDRFVGLKSESVYAAVFGVRRDPEATKNTVDAFNITGRAASKGTSLMFRTAGGSTNGLHPHVIIVDDPCDSVDRSSEAVRTAKQRWYDSLHPLLVPYTYTDRDGAAHTIRKIMFIATRWHLQDLPAYVQKKHGAKWDIETEGVYLPDGSPRYPELLPETALASLREDMSDVFFACQYLNQPLPEGAQIFSAAKLHYLRPDQFDVRQGTNYCFFDPSQGKAGGDFPAAVWFNVLNSRYVFFWAIDKKVELASLVPMIASYNREFRTRLMRYETNGTMGLDPELRRAHKEAGAETAIEGFHETRNKEERIYAMQPTLYRGAWHFRADHADVYPELMNQLVYFPAWGHDDFPDVIEKTVTWVATNMPGDFHATATKPSGTFAGAKSARSPW